MCPPVLCVCLVGWMWLSYGVSHHICLKCPLHALVILLHFTRTFGFLLLKMISEPSLLSSNPQHHSASTAFLILLRKLGELPPFHSGVLSRLPVVCTHTTHPCASCLDLLVTPNLATQIQKDSQASWLTSVIPAFERVKQESCYEFEPSMFQSSLSN